MPCGLNTRKASLNLCRESSRQASLFSRPYFFPIQALSPTLSRCGGSNTTIEKDASANDNARKSAIMSGLIIKRLPLRNVYPSFLISLNIARSSDLSNQNMRLPQHISRMVAGALTAPRPENYPDRKPVCAA